MNVKSSAFVDTNIFVYLYSNNKDDLTKREIAFNVLKEYDCEVSTQVLNEFANVCTKKFMTV